jgi:hypothetical protein
MKNKIKLGDTVKIVNLGEEYDAYGEVFKQLEFTDTGFRYVRPDKDVLWTVFKEPFQHPIYKEYTLVAIQNGEDQRLFGIDGLVKFIPEPDSDFKGIYVTKSGLRSIKAKIAYYKRTQSTDDSSVVLIELLENLINSSKLLT